MQIIDPRLRVRRHRAVETQSIAGGVIVAHLETGDAFRLNSTAALIWQEIESGTCAGDIAERLVTNHKIPQHRALRDAISLVAEMLRERLLVPAAPATSK